MEQTDACTFGDKETKGDKDVHERFLCRTRTALSEALGRRPRAQLMRLPAARSTKPEMLRGSEANREQPGEITGSKRNANKTRTTRNESVRHPNKDKLILVCVWDGVEWGGGGGVSPAAIIKVWQFVHLFFLLIQ